MKTKKLSVVAHGGAGSKNEHSDGTEEAVQTCRKVSRIGTSLLHSVAQAVAVLEDDGRYNAGCGSHARKNGKIEHDAAIMDSGGRFGAVAVLEGFKRQRISVHLRKHMEFQYLLIIFRPVFFWLPLFILWPAHQIVCY